MNWTQAKKSKAGTKFSVEPPGLSSGETEEPRRWRRRTDDANFRAENADDNFRQFHNSVKWTDKEWVLSNETQKRRCSNHQMRIAKNSETFIERFVDKNRR